MPTSIFSSSGAVARMAFTSTASTIRATCSTRAPISTIRRSGCSPWRALERPARVAQAEHQPMGGVLDEANLIGQRRVA
jgi:hypothetical protein